MIDNVARAEAAPAQESSDPQESLGQVQPPEAAPTATPSGTPTLAHAHHVAERLFARVRDSVMGRDEVIELTLVALLADGHILLEDYPGSGKTTLAKALGESIVEGESPVDRGPLSEEPVDERLATFRRVQFTPDLLPSDITGVMIFDTDNNNFSFRRGPIFAYIVLVDEINRTSPKVQAALLEAMAEKQVTVDNVSHALDELFFVIATQNPLDVAGTYPLPLAQIDRFLFKVRMIHVAREAELEVLETWGAPKAPCELPRVSRAEVIAARRAIREQVSVARAVKECLVDTARNLRDDSRVVQGMSTRALVQAIPALQTLAMLRGRDYVSSEDVEYLLPPLLLHRVEMIPGVDDNVAVIRAAAEEPVEALSRGTLR